MVADGAGELVPWSLLANERTPRSSGTTPSWASRCLTACSWARGWGRHRGRPATYLRRCMPRGLICTLRRYDGTGMQLALHPRDAALCWPAAHGTMDVSPCPLTVSVHAFLTHQFRRAGKTAVLTAALVCELRFARFAKAPRGRICHTQDRARPGTHNPYCRRLASVVCAIDKEARAQQTGFRQPLRISNTAMCAASGHPLWIAVPCWSSLAGRPGFFFLINTCRDRSTSCCPSEPCWDLIIPRLTIEKAATPCARGSLRQTWLAQAVMLLLKSSSVFIRAWARSIRRAKLISRGSFLAPEPGEGETAARDTGWGISPDIRDIDRP